jgi:hypothetical protein
MLSHLFVPSGRVVVLMPPLVSVLLIFHAYRKKNEELVQDVSPP